MLDTCVHKLSNRMKYMSVSTCRGSHYTGAADRLARSASITGPVVGRTPRQRRTDYGEIAPSRVAASFAAAPLSPVVNEAAGKFARPGARPEKPVLADLGEAN